MAKHNASTAQELNEKGIKMAATGSLREALDQFSKAISLSFNPLYFGNRAMVQFAGMPTAGDDGEHKETIDVNSSWTTDDFMTAAILLFERYSEANEKKPITKSEAVVWGSGIMTYLYGAACQMFVDNNPLVKPTSEDYYAVDYYKNYMVTFVSDKDAHQKFLSWDDMDKAFATFLNKMAEANPDKKSVRDQMMNVPLMYAAKLQDPKYLDNAREDVKHVLGHANRVEELRVIDRILFGDMHKDDKLYLPDNK